MFENRWHAGELLGIKIRLKLKDQKPNLVIGITRGGVVVAAEVARALRLPLDVLVIKKLGAPNNPELAVGAIGPKNSTYLDKRLLKAMRITHAGLMPIVIEKEQERFEQELALRGKKKPHALKNKTVILVDDGIATGATVLCAKNFLKNEKVKDIILAVPVIAQDVATELEEHFSKIITLQVAEHFRAVGQFYKEFRQVTDEEVRETLENHLKN